MNHSWSELKDAATHPDQCDIIAADKDKPKGSWFRTLTSDHLRFGPDSKIKKKAKDTFQTGVNLRSKGKKNTLWTVCHHPGCCDMFISMSFGTTE